MNLWRLLKLIPEHKPTSCRCSSPSCRTCIECGQVWPCDSQPPSSDEEWVESQLPVSYTDVVDLLEPVMKRIVANTGAYAGNYPADAARRVVDTITKAGWVIKRK